MEATAALADYARRVELYRTTYESLSEEDESQLSWMRLTDGGRSTCANRLHGYLPGKIMQFLSSLHTMPRNLYMTRHGQSEYNVLRKVGGDAGLSPLGEEYAVILAKVRPFIYRYIIRESCSQFDSLPLTSLLNDLLSFSRSSSATSSWRRTLTRACGPARCAARATRRGTSSTTSTKTGGSLCVRSRCVRGRKARRATRARAASRSTPPAYTALYLTLTHCDAHSHAWLARSCTLLHAVACTGRDLRWHLRRDDVRRNRSGGTSRVRSAEEEQARVPVPPR